MSTSQAIVTTEGPNGTDALAVIERADLADSTKRKYCAAMRGYLDAGGDPMDAEGLAAYAEGMTESSKVHLKAAVRVYSEHLRQQMNAQAAPMAENAMELEARMAQAERRIDALQNAVNASPPKGSKAHTWLTAAQVKAMLDSCGDDLKGQRDRLALGLLVAAGLRRAEAVSLTFDDVILQPVGDRMRTVLSIEGKGSKRRTVPVSDALANAIDQWAARVGGEGRVLRSFDQRGELTESLSAVGLFHIVRDAGARIGKPGLAPHDLRRSYAQLGYEAGIPLTQISKLLGHASLTTTQRYLDLELDLTITVSDFIPFE